MTEEAFDAPDGTVWMYRHVFHTSFGPDIVEEELFVVLPGYTLEAPGEPAGIEYRRFLCLETGEISWFREESHLNHRSTRYA